MKTVNDLINHCERALEEDWQYVYGAKGKKLNRNQILALQKRWGKDKVYDSDLNKAEKTCCDCSGLISSLTYFLAFLLSHGVLWVASVR